MFTLGIDISSRGRGDRTTGDRPWGRGGGESRRNEIVLAVLCSAVVDALSDWVEDNVNPARNVDRFSSPILILYWPYSALQGEVLRVNCSTK